MKNPLQNCQKNNADTGVGSKMLHSTQILNKNSELNYLQAISHIAPTLTIYTVTQPSSCTSADQNVWVHITRNSQEKQ